ncbi:MAG: peptidase C15 [Waterburya sp.]
MTDSIKLLLTSFQTWLPHQTSNSSDDLLEIIEKQQDNFNDLYLLRKLPVNTQPATQQVIETIKIINPQGIICCGMAESREILTIESNAVCEEDCIFTQINLDSLLTSLTHTAISHNAGKFVCEGLYYQILKYTQNHYPNIPCIFVHVPLLHKNNLDKVQQDFTAIINFMRFNL